jgi:hypothetical protein
MLIDADERRGCCDSGERQDVKKTRAELKPKGAKSPANATKSPSGRHESGIALASINTLLFAFLRLVWLRCCTLLRQLPTMVVLVDLDDDEPPSYETHTTGLMNVKPLHHCLAEDVQSVLVVDERPNPNINGFSAALSCYP